MLGGLLEAFVGHRVEEQMIVGLDDRQHTLAAGTCPAAKNHMGILLLDQPLGLPSECRPVGGTICDHPSDRAAEEPA